MANYQALITGQQAVLATAAALPGIGNTYPTSLTRNFGQGYRVLLHALKANSISVFYGGAGVTYLTGSELAPGQTDELILSDLALIYVIASTTGATVSWSVTQLN